MASAQWQMPFHWHEERKMKPFSYIYKPLIQKCQFIQAKTGNTGQKVEKKGILIAALLSLVTLTYYWTMDTGLQEGIANIVQYVNYTYSGIPIN